MPDRDTGLTFTLPGPRTGRSLARQNLQCQLRMSATQETTQVDRQLSSFTRLATVALLVGVAAIGCGNRGGATPAASTGSTPVPQATIVDQPPTTLTPTPTDSATDAASAGPSGSAGPSDSAAPSRSIGPSAANSEPTTDPVTTDITNLNNIINGIGGSVSGGDAGTSGGE